MYVSACVFVLACVYVGVFMGVWSTVCGCGPVTHSCIYIYIFIMCICNKHIYIPLYLFFVESQPPMAGLVCVRIGTFPLIHS